MVPFRQADGMSPMHSTSLRLLVFGGDGQVGSALRCGNWTDTTVTALTRRDADLTDSAAVTAAVRGIPCDVVVNAAAYTAVDRAEQDAATAWTVNRDGAGHIAAACAAAGRPLIHLSTDYVFDGTKAGPYTETDPVRPLGVYGASKAAGEEAVRAACKRHLIVRTSWVFGVHGANFVRTMLRLGEERDHLRVVADQTGCPTAACDIAAMIRTVAARLATQGADTRHGTVHFCGAPATTWHGFAGTVFSERERLTGRPAPRVEAITTAEYPTPARRPANSVLDTARLKAWFGVDAPDWRPALAATVAALCAPAAIS